MKDQFEVFDVSALNLSTVARVNVPQKMRFKERVVPARFYVQRSASEKVGDNIDRLKLYLGDVMNNSRSITPSFDWVLGVVWASKSRDRLMCDCFGYKLRDIKDWPGNPSEFPWLMDGTLIHNSSEFPPERGCGDGTIIRGRVEEPYRRIACREKGLDYYASSPPEIRGISSFRDIEMR